MDDKILAVSGLRAELLTAIGRTEAPHQQLREAEVLTTGVVARWCCRGNGEAARALVSTPREMPPLLSRSRVNRRLHRLTDLFVVRCDR